MLRMLRSEIFRLRKRPQSWVLGLVMIGGVVAVYAGLGLAAFILTDPDEPRRLIEPAQIFESGMQMVSGLSFLLIAIVSASIIGNEYSWGTIRPLVFRSRSRNALLTAKLLTLLIYTVGLLLVGFAASLVSSVIGTFIVGGEFELAAGLAEDWSVSILRLLLAQLPYAALTFFATLLARSTAVGIGVGIGIGILEAAVWGLASLVTDTFESVRTFGLDYPSSQLFNMNAELDHVTIGEASRAVAVLVVWSVIFVTATYYIFNQRDVTAG